MSNYFRLLQIFSFKSFKEQAFVLLTCLLFFLLNVIVLFSNFSYVLNFVSIVLIFLVS